MHECVNADVANGAVISGGHLVLDKELFEYTKPGLSSFADNPKKVIPI